MKEEGGLQSKKTQENLDAGSVSAGLLIINIAAHASNAEWQGLNCPHFTTQRLLLLSYLCDIKLKQSTEVFLRPMTGIRVEVPLKWRKWHTA
mmetsp:Transcript_34433/g.47992  ORF Transcript_34433/g.47992 Transcript_34433/m.47992 type:complete len:92 (-) Transcript_34433:630-905(-)